MTLPKSSRDRIVIVCAVVLALGLLRNLPVWDDLSNRVFDLLATRQPPVPDTPGIVLVAIDEPSFSEIGQQWPWPRTLHASLIDSLRRSGARAIGFDVVFAEHSNPQADAALASVSAADVVFAADETWRDNSYGETLVRTLPMPELVDTGAKAGIVSLELDGDGTARSMPGYPDAFARQLLRAAGHGKMAATEGDRIQYFGPPGTYPRVSYYQALEPERYLPVDMLRDKVVIVGFDLQASAEIGNNGLDMFETSFTQETRLLSSGSEIHATIYDNLLHDLHVRVAPEWVGYLLLAVGAFAGLAASRPQTPARKILLIAGIGITFAAMAWFQLRYARIWVSPTDPLLALIFTAASLGILDFALEQKRRREIHGAFSQYISPQMVDRLVASPELLKLGGERRDMTILFADLRGFTTISEAMKDDPEGLVFLISDILSPLTEIVIRHGGTIDKYMGDCIMAFWNAPLDDPDHAIHAIDAAREMISAIPQINCELIDRLPQVAGMKASVAIGIGINTGDCVVGNLGSQSRFDYSVLGDPVNAASRMEALCKKWEVPVIIGKDTRVRCGDQAEFRSLGFEMLRGKTGLIEIYTLDGSRL